jgi:thiosulfate/3-mercaptopyruvate sulfurtransferase
MVINAVTPAIAGTAVRKFGCKASKEKETIMMTGIPQEEKCFIKRAFVLFLLAVICNLLLGGFALASNLGLIEPGALKQNLSGWVILDARPKSEWTAGHIPGAISFSWEDYTRTDKKGIPYRAWRPAELAAELGKLGIDVNASIVVYGDADKSWGGEGWDCWVLSWLGHKGPIRLLDGGIQVWRNNNFPTTQAPGKRNLRPVQYKFKLQPHLDISTADLERQKPSSVVIDTRSFLEWIRGRIPGAIRINWTDLYTGRDRRPLPPGDFKKLLRDHGVDINKSIVYYCTGGIRSGYAWMVHQLSGLPPARNYEGGFEAWKRLSSGR